MSKPTTGRYSIKPYKCTNCGNEEEHGTNHWGDIYCKCHVCCNSVWECTEPIPKGFGVPPKWKQVRLGDIAEIKEA